MEIRIRKVVTFTVDVEEWARDYGIEPHADAVREDFASYLTMFEDHEGWSSAWPGLVTQIKIRNA